MDDPRAAYCDGRHRLSPQRDNEPDPHEWIEAKKARKNIEKIRAS